MCSLFFELSALPIGEGELIVLILDGRKQFAAML